MHIKSNHLFNPILVWVHGNFIFIFFFPCKGLWQGFVDRIPGFIHGHYFYIRRHVFIACRHLSSGQKLDLHMWTYLQSLWNFFDESDAKFMSAGILSDVTMQCDGYTMVLCSPSLSVAVLCCNVNCRQYFGTSDVRWLMVYSVIFRHYLQQSQRNPPIASLILDLLNSQRKLKFPESFIYIIHKFSYKLWLEIWKCVELR